MIYIPGGFTANLEKRINSVRNDSNSLAFLAPYSTDALQQLEQSYAQSHSDSADILPGQLNNGGVARQDAPGSGLYLTRYLQQKLSRVLFRRYPRLRFESGEVCPIIYDLVPGANTITQDIIDSVGEAKILADEAFDIPLVDISAEQDEYRVIRVAGAFHYTMQQIDAARFANVPLRDRKIQAVRMAISQRLNTFYAYGNSTMGLPGFLNNPNVDIVDSSFNPYDSANDVDDFSDFFVDLLGQIINDSLMTETPNRWIIPSLLKTRLVKLRIANTNLNAYQYVAGALNDLSPGFQILAINEVRSQFLEANGIHASGLNKDRFVLYDASGETAEIHADTVQTAPTEYSNMRYMTPMYQCTSPVIIQRTASMKYVQVAKA